ncbi:hypothetical protein [Devosia ginsengisoli]|uniref:Uncharacterized protein n=1 Tax=Devosia ginsengisoli TaxID=400770 RepID=A0A5B8LMM3_9HYPH|nr:hypothetical protein [Devosia ginsengisoli]QDZ09373.1 hypothetical protein FPZ08_00565 [Devosia ginsengisoli]
MRIFLALIFALIAAPAFAQGWEHYENGRFGYGVDIPPGFSDQNFSDNGDGASFAAGGNPTYLTVWGGNLTDSFEDEVSQRMAWGESEAWNTTYQAVTPRWASWSAVKGSRILYQRIVLLCDGTSYAAFRMEYSVTDVSEMNPVVERLVGSLRGNC